MSCYVVSNKTVEAIARGFIDYDVPFGYRDDDGTFNTATARGQFIVGVRKLITEIAEQLLWKNCQAFDYRYDGRHHDEIVDREFEIENVMATMGELVGCIECLDYQCAELPDWEESFEHKSLEALKNKVVYRFFENNNAVVWGID